jgi:anti-sigma factor RsiW
MRLRRKRAPRDGTGLTCLEVVELVTDFLEGALEPALHGRVERHLRGCTGCAAHLDQLRETIALLGHLPEAAFSTRGLAELEAAFADWAR